MLSLIEYRKRFITSGLNKYNSMATSQITNQSAAGAGGLGIIKGRKSTRN